MQIRVIQQPIPKAELEQIARAQFGDLVKAVVDVEQEVMAIGGELHADEEVVLMEQHGAKREHTWGINLYPVESSDAWIEFDSLINLKPALGNRSRGVDNPGIREKIKSIVNTLVRN